MTLRQKYLRNIRRALVIAAALAATSAGAQPDSRKVYSIYGMGTETCQVALSHNWMTTGEFSWVAGAMTIASIQSESGDVSPQTSPTDLVGVVFQQCQAHPFGTLSEATIVIASRLIQRQAKPVKGGVQF